MFAHCGNVWGHLFIHLLFYDSSLISQSICCFSHCSVFCFVVCFLFVFFFFFFVVVVLAFICLFMLSFVHLLMCL